MSEVRTPPERLADLDPRWIGASGEREGVGIRFECPCRSESCAWGGLVGIAFANPLDGGAGVDGMGPRWQRTGDTFETLTLSPSIHLVGHWHGWLRNGVLESC